MQKVSCKLDQHRVKEQSKTCSGCQKNVLWNTFGITYTEIAKILNKNHATILHNVNQHNNFIKILKSYKLNFEEIEALLIEDDNYYIHEIVNIERKIDELYKKLDDLLEKKEQYKSKLINK